MKQFNIHKIYILILSFLMITPSFFGCATTQDFIITNEKLFEQESRLKNLEEKVKKLREKDLYFERELHELLRNFADLETQLKQDYEQVLALDARLEDYRQLLDRSLSNSTREAENTLMKLARMEGIIEKFSQELKAFHAAKSHMSSQAAYNMENLDEEAFYNMAYTEFQKGVFDKARELFNEFLKKFPDGKFSDNARFWIGECYYRKNQYEEAILEYEKVKKDYPSGDKVPSALFKQGLSFLKLNKKEAAKIILNDLIKHYPQSEQAGMAKEQLEKLE
jgi:tol-pal system protein YbgF